MQSERCKTVGTGSLSILPAYAILRLAQAAEAGEGQVGHLEQGVGGERRADECGARGDQGCGVVVAGDPIAVDDLDGVVEEVAEEVEGFSD